MILAPCTAFPQGFAAEIGRHSSNKMQILSCYNVACMGQSTAARHKERSYRASRQRENKTLAAALNANGFIPAKADQNIELSAARPAAGSRGRARNRRPR